MKTARKQGKAKQRKILNHVMYNEREYQLVDPKQTSGEVVAYKLVDDQDCENKSILRVCSACGLLSRNYFITNWHWVKFHSRLPKDKERCLRFGDNTTDDSPSNFDQLLTSSNDDYMIKENVRSSDNQIKKHSIKRLSKKTLSVKPSSKKIKKETIKASKKVPLQRENDSKTIKSGIKKRNAFDILLEKAKLANKINKKKGLLKPVLRQSELKVSNQAINMAKISLPKKSIKTQLRNKTSDKNSNCKKQIQSQKVSTMKIDNRCKIVDHSKKPKQRSQKAKKSNLISNSVDSVSSLPISAEATIKELQQQVQKMKGEYEQLEEDNRVEFLKLNAEHLDRVFEERERHVHLYQVEADMINAKRKLDEQATVIARQRKEINWTIYRFSRYAPREMANYPKHLLKDGNPDADIWELTRESKEDEQIINDLREQLIKQKQDHIAMIRENLSLKNILNVHLGFPSIDFEARMDEMSSDAYQGFSEAVIQSFIKEGLNEKDSQNVMAAQATPDRFDIIIDTLIKNQPQNSCIGSTHQQKPGKDEQNDNKARVSFLESTELDLKTKNTKQDVKACNKFQIQRTNIDPKLKPILTVAQQYGQEVVWQNDKPIIQQVFEYKSALGNQKLPQKNQAQNKTGKDEIVDKK